jgi:hypothetical protein
MSEKPNFYKGFFEPESAANTDYQPEYRYNHTKETPRGHLFEMDDTPTRERIRLSHRSNTFVEMHPNGDMVQKVFGDGYEIVVKDKNVLIKGACNITIEGDCNMYVKGDVVETIDGNYEQHIKGHYTQFVEKTHTVVSQGDMKLTGGSSLTGSVIIQAGDSLIIDTDLSVRGEIYGKKITSETRVDAVTGMSAGPQGFVTLTGGVAVGIPVAVPTKVLVASDVIAGGTVDAGAAVNAPLGNFGVMGAVLMEDVTNSAIFNTHIHPSPKGPTGTPTTQFVMGD